MGVYEDPEIQAYLEALGQRLAAASERPDLPWTFRVLDDPVVNAFALPGGFIYVTRGIMAHLNSEAELTGVLGHEIGHVTARHAVNRISKAQLATLGLGVGMILEPGLRSFGDLAQAGLGLLFLKYSRDDERQADDLGLRYLLRTGYDPGEMVEVFGVLARISQARGEEGRLPDWLSTHPDPGARQARMTASIRQLGRDFSGATVDREGYLLRLQGMVFGENPRQGYFRDGAFFHPELAFRMEFPQGWQTSNQKRRVGGLSPSRDAALELTLAAGDSPPAAAREFFGQGGVEAGRSWRQPVGGLPAVWGTFSARSGGAELRGVAAFVAYGGRVYRLLGYGVEATWGRHDEAVRRSVSSFAPLKDPAALAVEPARIDLVRTDRPLSLEQIQRLYPSSVPGETIGLINHLETGGEIPAGALAKRVVGGRLPGAGR